MAVLLNTGSGLHPCTPVLFWTGMTRNAAQSGLIIEPEDPPVFAPFLLTLVLASAPADDPPDAVTLIGRLGSESFDDRVAAYKALERTGRRGPAGPPSGRRHE